MENIHPPLELHQEQITKRSTRYEDTCKRSQYSQTQQGIRRHESAGGLQVAEDRGAGVTQFLPQSRLFSGPPLTGIIVLK